MKFKAKEVFTEKGSTIIEQTFLLNKSFEYYMTMAEDIENIMKMFMDRFNINKSDISSDKDSVFHIKNNDRLIYDLNSNYFRFKNTEINKLDKLPTNKKNITSIESTVVLTDILIACSYLDELLFEFITAVFNNDKGVTGNFQIVNQFVAGCIFEQKL